MKVIIIGGVAGGACAAARLRRLQEDWKITLLERGPHISYANCALPYYVGGTIEDESKLTLQTPESFRARFNIDVHVNSNVSRIDRAKQELSVLDTKEAEHYTLRYDMLLLAPGAHPVRPPLPGLDAQGVYTLRDVPDALALRALVKGGTAQSVIVIGGGSIGIEMAENFHQAGLAVHLVEKETHVLPQLDGDMAAQVHMYLRAKGIHLHLDNGLTHIEQGDSGLVAHLERGALAADMVLLCIGVRPEVQLARDAGLAIGPRGGIVVDEHLRTSDPAIWAVGDAIQVRNALTGLPALMPLAGPASKQGRIAANNIAGGQDRYLGTQGSSVLKVFDLTVATTGLSQEAAARAGIICDAVHLFPASHASYYPGSKELAIKVLYAPEDGRILGAQLLGESGADKRADVIATAIHFGARAHDLAQLELCYAPPYSSAKDPVNMAGFMIGNLLEDKVKHITPAQWDALPTDGSVQRLDVRLARETAAGHIADTLHIPLDALRDHLGELDAKKPVYVHCQSGVRSYVACRLLAGHGFTSYNLSGGYRLYSQIANERIHRAQEALGGAGMDS